MKINQLAIAISQYVMVAAIAALIWFLYGTIAGLIALVLVTWVVGFDLPSWVIKGVRKINLKRKAFFRARKILKRQKVKVDRVIGQYATFVIGIAFCSAVALVPTIPVALVLAKISWFLGIPVFVMMAGISYVFCFHNQIVTIPINYHGVIFFLDSPVFGTFVLGTGKNWKLPFTKVVTVNVSEQIMNIPASKDDPGFTVLTLKEAREGETGGKLSLLVRAAPRYQVRCSRTYIMFENEPSINKLFEELRNKIISALRLIASGLDDETFTRSKDLLASSMLSGKVNDILQLVADAIPDPSVTADKVIEHSINSIALTKWGVEVLEIIISKAEPKNNEQVEEFRMTETKERYQRRSEKTEIVGMRERVDYLAQYFIDIGKMEPQDAVREANRLVMAQTNKVTSYDFGPGGGGDVTRGAAIYAGTTQPTKKT